MAQSIVQLAQVKNIAGHRFGLLFAIRPVDSVNGKVRWLCQCDCGKTAIVFGSLMRRGVTTSCGCRKYVGLRPPIVDQTGKVFGRLTVLGRAENRKHGRIAWRCLCTCGTVLIVTSNALQRSNTKSCGCLNREKLARGNRTHGKSRTPEYLNWLAMRSRCNNPKNHDYALYGGRGIKVCDRWNTSFVYFLADMGLRPPGQHTIDRINPDGDYELGNCRWASQQEQVANKRR